MANFERNTFVRGLITEANPLTYPENASKSEDNFILKRDGSRKRRLGVDYELNYALNSALVDYATLSDLAISTYKWINPGNEPSKTINVIQVGRRIYLFDGSANAPSANLLQTFSLGDGLKYTPAQYTSINGDLLFVNAGHAYTRITATYSSPSSAPTFVLTSPRIYVRDIWGAEDATRTDDERPTSITDAVTFYNYYNQGWPLQKVILDLGPDPDTGLGGFWGMHATPLSTGTNNDRSLIDWEGWPLYIFYQLEGNYPSYYDVYHLGRTAENKFSVHQLVNSDPGGRLAARGRAIIDVFDRGQFRSNQLSSQYAAAPSYLIDPTVYNTTKSTLSFSDQETGRFSTIVTYAGRVFYSGIDSSVTNPTSTTPHYSTMIFFTQVVENGDSLGKCYSVNDPTSADFSEALPSDGGSMPIPEVNRIVKLVTTSVSLLVFAENGVWQITGPDGVFRADDFSISKISSVGALGAESIVQVEDSVFFWAMSGIYVLTPDPSSGRLAASNITETTIQTYYTEDISSLAKSYATGIYDEDNRTVRWLYNDMGSYDGINYRNKYNRELTFDLVLQAFSTKTFGELDTDSPYIAGYVQTANFTSVVSSEVVTVNGVPVQVNGVNVTVDRLVRGTGIGRIRYLVVKPNAIGDATFTFAQERDANFLDWVSDDATGVDAPAHLLTGYEMFADSARNKQSVYMTAHFKMTETAMVTVGDDLDYDSPSSCLVRSQWDWVTIDIGGKVSEQFEAYRLPRNYVMQTAGNLPFGSDVVTTKNKLRGTGRSLALRFDTSPGKDCHIYGWALDMEGTPRV